MMRAVKLTVVRLAAVTTAVLAVAASAGAAPFVRIHVDNYPIGVAVEGTSVWVSTHRDSLLYRIDTRTNAVVDRIDIGQNACGQVGVAFGRVWVPHCDTASSVVVLDATSKQVVGKVDAWPLKIAFGYGSAWMWNPGGDGSELVRVDPSTLQIVAHIPLPAGGSPFKAPDGIWVVGDNGTLSRIDPASNQVTRTFRYGAAGEASAIYAGGSIYVLNDGSARLLRVDPKTGRSTRVAVGLVLNQSDPDLELGGGVVWAAPSNLQLVGIDARSGRVVRRIKTTVQGSAYIAVGAGAVWEPSQLGDAVFRNAL